MMCFLTRGEKFTLAWFNKWVPLREVLAQLALLELQWLDPGQGAAIAIATISVASVLFACVQEHHVYYI